METKGFVNNDTETAVIGNGTYFTKRDFFPVIGYDAHRQLADPDERRRRGLGPTDRLAGISELEDLTAEESAELMAFTQKVIRVIKSVSRPHGFNVGLNLGNAAGGSLADNLHMHVVPRWSGDANFITIIGGSKIVPQLLRETRELLATEWAKQP